MFSALETLEALRVGPGSWSAKHLERMIPVVPPSLRNFLFDCRLELKNDLGEGSSALAIFEKPFARLSKLTLIADNVSGGTPAEQAAAAMAAANATAVDAAAAEMAAMDLGGGGVTWAPVLSEEAGRGLERLRSALGPQAPHLAELDASSGALAAEGAVALIEGVLGAAGASLRVLRVARLSPSIATMACLAKAVAANASLTMLDLSSNMIHGTAVRTLAEAVAVVAGLPQWRN